MKMAIVLTIILVVIAGCSGQKIKTENTISGIQDLMLSEQELQQLGMKSFGTDCYTDDEYSNIVDSSTGQYSFCNYTIESLNDTEIIIELQKFADYEALNGSYQYQSSHYFSAEGLISENDFGDQSRFRVNNENDYGGQYNKPGVYFYHLWFTKDLYLIHITSKGSSEAKDYISKIGLQILSKFG